MTNQEFEQWSDTRAAKLVERLKEGGVEVNGVTYIPIANASRLIDDLKEDNAFIHGIGPVGKA